MSYVVGLPNNSYKPITDTPGFAPGFANYKIRRTRFAVSSDKVFSCLPMVGGSLRVLRRRPAFSTTKTGRHDIAEILLKVTLNTINKICVEFCV